MKRTKVIALDSKNLEDELKAAGDAIRRGCLVAFPTETVYGLGADALNEDAVERIFLAKGRPQDNPLIVHIFDRAQLEQLVEEVPEDAKILMEKFWPGPLTILFKKKNTVPGRTTGGLDTVAVRMPDNPLALRLIEYSQRPIAAPSANTSGRPSPTKAEHVLDDLSGKVDIVIDGGSTGVGLESTVLDISGDCPVILRPGGVTREQLLEVIRDVKYDLALQDERLKPKSPGQKYRHYSPKAKLEVYYGEGDKAVKAILSRKSKLEESGHKVGILTVSEHVNMYSGEHILSMGSGENLEEVARNLFGSLRQFDSMDVDIILGEGLCEEGIGKAIVNRLFKASGGNIFYL